MEGHELKEFKVAVMKILNEIKENSERQFNMIMKKTNEQKGHLLKTLKLFLKSRYLELRNSINEMKIGNRADQMEESKKKKRVNFVW